MLDDDFNPRSREGSDKDVNRLETLITISIHAPAKGATFTGSPLNVLSTDFNPRSREGSDCQRLVRRSKQKNFNPRSREGSDGSGDDAHATLDIISIHAPAKGATVNDADYTDRRYISIHAPAKGATFNDQTFRPFMPISIHAPAKGATEN